MTKQNLLQNVANVLYGKKDEEQKTKSKERNSLLNELDGQLTPIQILYSSNDELKKIKESTSKKPLDNFNSREEWEADEDFKKALNFVKQVEGGYSNYKADKGGKTNLGITQITYDEYNRKRNLPLKNIANITEKEASKIYYEDFWKKSGAKELQDKSLGLMLFDSAVNHGIGGAKKYYEKSGGDFEKFYQLRKEYYDNRIIEKPDQKIFHKGWINRIDKLQKYKNEYY